MHGIFHSTPPKFTVQQILTARAGRSPAKGSAAAEPGQRAALPTLSGLTRSGVAHQFQPTGAGDAGQADQLKALHDLGIRNPDYIDRILDGSRSVVDTLGFIADRHEQIEQEFGAGYVSHKLSNLLADNSTCPYLANGMLTQAEILALQQGQIHALDSLSVQWAMNHNLMDKEQALTISEFGIHALGRGEIRQALAEGLIKADVLLDIDETGWGCYGSAAVQKYRAANLLSWHQALHLEPEQMSDLELPAIQQLLDNGSISMDRLFEMSHQERLAHSRPR